MIDMDDRIREKLEAEASEWVEEELVARMARAREAIEYQADLSAGTCGYEAAKQHVREAAALAEQNYRMELELEAQERVEAQMKERTRPLLEDHDLEGNFCTT